MLAGPVPDHAEPRESVAVILLVDDSDDNRAIYCALLEHRGHTCLEAADGAAGIRLAVERLPDLILLDLGMPVMDGWQAVAALKANPATARIPVIALTAHVLDGVEAQALDAGFDGFIRKPATPMSVVEAVERMVGARIEGFAGRAGQGARPPSPEEPRGARDAGR